MNDMQRLAASHLGRGRTVVSTAKIVGRSERTIKRWRAHLPGFAEEIARVAANAERPDPMGTLVDALSATRDDRVDWPSRIAGARALIAAGWGEAEDNAAPSRAGPVVTVVESL